MLIINFFIQGICKILGFKKRYDILQLLGTTKLGDIHKICYNWPNIFKRILLDGTLDFVIIPYLLEGNSLGHQEFVRRNTQLLNTILIIILMTMGLFIFLTPYLTESITFPFIGYYFILYFILIIPIGINIVFNEILLAKSYFILNNTGQILNNLTFIISLFFFKNNMLMGVWQSLFLGFMVNNLYTFIFIIYKGYLKFSWDFLPFHILKDMVKSGIFQIANRLNHIIANMLGSRLLVPGILIASDLIDNITHSIVSIFTTTIIIIMTPKFYDYFSLNNKKYKKLCQEIIVSLLMATFIISGYLFLNAKFVIKFLIQYKPNIDQPLLSSILQWSSGQIFIISIIKIAQRVLTIQKQLNRTIFIALGSSVISSLIEWFFFNKYHVYCLIFSHYIFLLMELSSMVFFLRKNNQWYQLWQDISWISIAKLFFMALIALMVSPWLNGFAQGDYFHWKFLGINGLWGLGIVLVFWPQWKIFIRKI